MFIIYWQNVQQEHTANGRHTGLFAESTQAHEGERPAPETHPRADQSAASLERALWRVFAGGQLEDLRP